MNGIVIGNHRSEFVPRIFFQANDSRILFSFWPADVFEQLIKRPKAAVDNPPFLILGPTDTGLFQQSCTFNVFSDPTIFSCVVDALSPQQFSVIRLLQKSQTKLLFSYQQIKLCFTMPD